MQVKLDDNKIKYIIREKKGTPISTIAESMDISTRHVRRLCARYKNTRQIPTMGSRGRPATKTISDVQVELVLAECMSGGSGVGRVTNWRADHIYNNEKARTGRTVPGKVDKTKTGEVRAHVL